MYCPGREPEGGCGSWKIIKVKDSVTTRVAEVGQCFRIKILESGLYNVLECLMIWPEKAMAPYSSTLAWKILWTEEPGSCSPRGCEESDTTEWLHFHFSLSCTGEGNGNSLQCSCLENPRDGGAWWAAVYGVAQSRTRLKGLSSSSSHVSSLESNFPPFSILYRSKWLTQPIFKAGTQIKLSLLEGKYPQQLLDF